jgi:cytochrome P450
MSWTLFELTKHPDVQAKLRAEIQAAEQSVYARGDTEFTAEDFDSMAYTIAVMKVRCCCYLWSRLCQTQCQETLRFHPVVYGSAFLDINSIKPDCTAGSTVSGRLRGTRCCRYPNHSLLNREKPSRKFPSRRERSSPSLSPVITGASHKLTDRSFEANLSVSRNLDVFGEDAQVFNPERWLDDTVQLTTRIGPYANL